MAGLDPAIHAARLGAIFTSRLKRFGVDARVKPGHDGSHRDYAFLSFQPGSEEDRARWSTGPEFTAHAMEGHAQMATGPS